MPRPYDILAFGDTCVDLVLRADDIVPQFGQAEKLVASYELTMGGSCCIFAAQAAKLGLKVALLGAVGADAFGTLILDTLAAAGVDTRHIRIDPALRTGLTVQLAQGEDRAMLTHLGSASALTAADVTRELLASARHLHYGSLYLQAGLLPQWVEIVRRAKAQGLTVSLDTNWDPSGTWDVGLEAAFPHIDLLLPNEQEALYLSGQPSLDAALAHLRERVPLLIVKLAEKGALAWQGGSALRHAARHARGGGDGIGAGDSFAAGFLAGWLNQLPLADCLAIACTCGREVASEIGGTAGQPTLAAFPQLQAAQPA